MARDTVHCQQEGGGLEFKLKFVLHHLFPDLYTTLRLFMHNVMRPAKMTDQFCEGAVIMNLFMLFVNLYAVNPLRTFSSPLQKDLKLLSCTPRPHKVKYLWGWHSLWWR